MQRFPLFRIYSRPSSDHKKGFSFPLGSKSAVVSVAESDPMPGQIPDPSVPAGSLPSLGPLAGPLAGSLPSLGPLAGLSATALTHKLKHSGRKYQNYDSVMSPLHFLDSLGKRPLVIKTERDEEDDRRKRRREKNKVAAARCRNKKKERTDYLQKESERLEMLNSDLKAQIEELKMERQQLIVLLNRHRPTCIVRTDSVKTPEEEEEEEGEAEGEVEGEAEGEVEGEAEGEAEGEVEGEAEDESEGEGEDEDEDERR